MIKKIVSIYTQYQTQKRHDAEVQQACASDQRVQNDLVAITLRQEGLI